MQTYPQLKRKTKADLAAHFKMRLQQRYGITINKDGYKALIQQVQSGAAKFLFKESNTRTHFLLNEGGTDVVAVYNSQLKALCTALPLNT